MRDLIERGLEAWRDRQDDEDAIAMLPALGGGVVACPADADEVQDVDEEMTDFDVRSRAWLYSDATVDVQEVR